MLQEGGATLDDVVKATIFLTNMERFKQIKPIRDRYFAHAKPASTVVEISRTVKKGCNLEIEVIAMRKK